MAIILNIETSTQVCSVALAQDGKLLALREAAEANVHAKMLTTFVEECLQEAQYKLSDIDAVAISQGPGSYTGLRIGLSTAKGLCYALDKPLIAVDTLQAMACLAAAHTNHTDDNLWYMPMIDARRMEVYTAAYNSACAPQNDVEALILEPDSLDATLKAHTLVISGDGAEKTIPLYKQKDKVYIYPDITNSAQGMIGISYQKWQAQNFEDLAYFTPFYLKAFVAAPAKVKGLYT